MKRSQLLPSLMLLAFLLCAFFAADRYFAMSASEAALSETAADISAAQAAISQFPEVFAAKAQAQAAPLKPLVQEASARNGVSLAFLSETEKDIGEGVRERSVFCRAINVEQAKLIKFLCELENRGGGARIKELRLKPSAERNGLFQEAEGVLSVRSLSKNAFKRAEGGSHARP